MTKSFQDLSSEQVAKFQSVCQKFGIDPANVPVLVSTAAVKGGVLCGHPAGSIEFPIGKTHVVDNVQDLNALIGCADKHYASGAVSDDFVSYPPVASTLNLPTVASSGANACKLKASMTVAQRETVMQALNAYLMGNSAKVADYEEHINTLYFPVKMATQAAQDIVVYPDNPLVIDSGDGSPTTIIAGTVTVMNGAQIIMKTPLNLQCQVFIQE